MTAPPPPPAADDSGLRGWAARLGLLVVLLAALDLVWRALGIEAFRTLGGGLTFAVPNTAVAMLLLGGGVWMLAQAGRVVRARSLGLALAVGGAAIGGFTLVEHAFAWNPGFDELVMSAEPIPGSRYPGRMPAAIAIAIVFMGAVAVPLSSARRRRARVAADGLAIVGFLLGWLGVLGFVYGVDSREGAPYPMRFALSAAVMLCVLSLAVGLAAGRVGLTAVLTGRGPGGVMAWRIFAVMLLLPLVGGLAVFWERQGIYSSGFAGALIVVAALVATGAVASLTARRIESAHARRLSAEADLRARSAELEAANAELEAFAYSVSHDLRAPLRAIDGFSQMVLRGYADRLDERGRHALERVRAGSQRMGLLIDEILQLSRISRRELRLEAVDLSSLAEEVVAELRGEQPECAAISVSVEPGLTARGDRGLLAIALTNLLGNAFKFSAEVPDARVEVGSRRDGGQTVFYVRDNGVGFDMAYADKLFRPFERLHSEERFAGSGVGLATVQRVLRRHGGTVWAESEPGHGATFYFSVAPDLGKRTRERKRCVANIRCCSSRTTATTRSSPWRRSASTA